MKRKWRIMLCATALVLEIAPISYAETKEVNSDEAKVLVGLAYGAGSLPGANLSNSDGSGFRFGYLDEDRNFWQVAYTAETAISVMKTQNVWYGLDTNYSSSLKSYSDKITSDISVGCWHVQVPTESELTTYEDTVYYAQSYEGFPAWINGEWQIRIGAYTTREEAQLTADAVGGIVVGTSSYGVSVVKTGTSTVLFQFDGEETASLAVAPGLDDSVKVTTNFRNRRYYGLFQFKRVNGEDLVVSNLLPLGDYINCVISREMSPSWPLEALKAQAVSARSYYEDNLGKHKTYGFDICSTTDCQAYYGMANVNERTEQAVVETENLRAWYNGEPAKTFYYASNGGGSEDVKNVWGSSYPYLCGVNDPFEETVLEKIAYWDDVQVMTGAELNAKVQPYIQSKGYNCAAIVDFQITEYTPTGNVKSILFTDANGKEWPFTQKGATDFRSVLGLHSIRYTVSKSGETTGGAYYVDGSKVLTSMSGLYSIGGDGKTKKITENPYVITADGVQFLPAPDGGTATGEVVYTFQSRGWGHSVGMSQWGAYAMAEQGYTFDEILKFYYPGIEIY